MAGVNLSAGGAGGKLVSVGLLAGLGLYGLSEGLYNVEGGHRAIVFSRIGGIKDQVLTSLNKLDFIFKFVWCCIRLLVSGDDFCNLLCILSGFTVVMGNKLS